MRTTPAAAPAPTTPAKTRPHRTPQTPFDKDDETLYAIDKITAVRFVKGVRQYLVRWEGYAAAHDTWEPMENLVGCAQQIREYEKVREEEDRQGVERALAKRQKAKDDAAAEQARLKAHAAEIALDGTDDGTASGEARTDARADAVLKIHQ